MFKRFSVMVFAALLVLTLLPMSVFAQELTLCENGHDFIVAEDGSKACSVCKLTLVKVSGDVNADGDVDHLDAILLLYNSVFGSVYYPLADNYDFNLNGEIDANDAIHLLSNTLYGEAEYPLFVSADPDYDEDKDDNIDENDKDQGFEDWIPFT